jgi:phosphoglycerol transferase MdoB-like AlkP superfamily enzyme
MTRNEQEMYSNISSIAKSLEKIANALDTPNVVYNGELKNTKDIPGFEGTLDALDNLCNVSTKDEEYDFDVHNDYLNDLVQGMNQIEFLQFQQQCQMQFMN